MTTEAKAAESPLSRFLSFRARWGIVAAAGLVVLATYGAYRVATHIRK